MKMGKTDLTGMPKEVMIASCANELALAQDKLPEHLQNDGILKYQYCNETYNVDSNSGSTDAFGGPTTR